MGKCAAGDEIYADLGELLQTLDAHVAGSFEFRLALGHSDGLRGHLIGHVVEHDDVGLCIEGFLEHSKVFDFYFDLSYERRIGAGHLDGFGDRAGSADVVVLDEDTVRKIIAVVRAAADTYCVLFERTHVRSGLSGVEELGVIALEFFCHRMGKRRDAAHALQEVERCSLAA